MLLVPAYSSLAEGCPTTSAQKRTRQFRLVLWVVTVWRYLVEVQGGEWMNALVCATSF